MSAVPCFSIICDSRSERAGFRRGNIVVTVSSILISLMEVMRSGSIVTSRLSAVLFSDKVDVYTPALNLADVWSFCFSVFGFRTNTSRMIKKYSDSYEYGSIYYFFHADDNDSGLLHNCSSGYNVYMYIYILG